MLTDVGPGCECMVMGSLQIEISKRIWRCLGIARKPPSGGEQIQRTFDYCSGEWETDCIVWRTLQSELKYRE